ncbi:MAG: MTH938/NDUFAF3 family protein [Anaerolineae bacterium]|jgi:hypothetical protein
MSKPQIEDYRFGRIVVDKQVHTKDLIILPDRIVGGWWRSEGHRLLPEDLESVLEARPAVLVVGKGAYGRLTVAAQTRRTLEEAGIELIAQSTKKACQTYNQLRLQQPVAAALHLTC